MKLCRKLDALYIDTVVEPWLGFYFDKDMKNADRTNYALRETASPRKGKNPGGATAVSTCGANPGMVSWFVKQALVNLANDMGLKFERAGSARPRRLGEADEEGRRQGHPHRRARHPAHQPSEAAQRLLEHLVGRRLHLRRPAAGRTRLGHRTKNWMPKNAKKHKKGCKAAIYLEQPGANTRVRTWCPTPGPQYGFLVTHNESISIADFFTVRDKDGEVTYPPDLPLRLPSGQRCRSLAARDVRQRRHAHSRFSTFSTRTRLVDGIDELGVLLYGHEKNAFWYGSRLSLEETRRIAPYQNATGLQVTSAVLAGMVWALEHPTAGIVEADEMDYKRCLEVQLPYLGPVEGHYTDWTPLDGRPGLFPKTSTPRIRGSSGTSWFARNQILHQHRCPPKGGHF